MDEMKYELTNLLIPKLIDFNEVEITDKYSEGLGYIKIGIFNLETQVGMGDVYGFLFRKIALKIVPGFSIIAIAINDARQLFTAVKGIKELPVDILHKIKLLKFSVPNDRNRRDTFTLVLKTQKEGIVKADLIETTDGIVILNKNLTICTLDRNSELDLKILIAYGREHVEKEKHIIKPYLAEGFILIDTFFSPVIYEVLIRIM